MKNLPCIRSRCGSRDGVALVMVLAFIVLLTILIVGMVSFTRLNRLSTASYSKSIQAQEIAQGGLQDILNDVHSEIVAGSTNNAAVYVVGTGSNARVYIPKTNYAATPAHLGYPSLAWGTDVHTPKVDQLSPLLLRVSRASQDGTPTDLYPPMTASYYDSTLIPINRASPASTAKASANGRSIPYTRWNQTFLIACDNNTNDGNAPYCMPGVFVSTNYTTDANYSGSGQTVKAAGYTGPSGPPDWVYVTRSGSRPCALSDLPNLIPNSAVTTTTYSTATGQNPGPVVGRYAYVMYDEGATLDMGSAGFYSTDATTVTSATSYGTNVAYPGAKQTVMGKSFLPNADLSISTLMQSQDAVNSFVAWRNASLASPSNALFLNAVFNYAQTGFLNFQSGDSPLLSRQDMINYFAKIDPYFNAGTGSSVPSGALPYLGTFNRAVSAPSYVPPLNASSLGGNDSNGGSGAVYAYHDNAEATISAPFSTSRDNVNPATTPGPNPNRDMANVRFINGGTITHYLDNATKFNPDGSNSTYTVNPGDPLLQNRFSLARIAWLSQADPNSGTGPSTSYIAPIQSCFGLIWGQQGLANGGQACWTYAGSTTGTLANPPNHIETLDEVATERREPNFFELLKAAILSGSLGLDPGVCAWANANGTLSPYGFRDANPYYGGCENLEVWSFDHLLPIYQIPAPSRIADMQILKIGASIIDQFDADSYPTAIYFPYTGMTSTYDASSSLPTVGPNHMQYGESDMVFGDENLPYLTSVYLIPGTVHSTDKTDMNGWLQPQIWNPHQMPSSYTGPTTFRIQAYGQASLNWGHETQPTSPSPPGPPPGEAAGGDTLIMPGNGQMDGNAISIGLNSSTAYQQFYPLPVPLVTTTTGVAVAPTSSSPNKTFMVAATDMTDYTMNPFVAFWLGDDSTYQVDPDSGVDYRGGGSQPFKTKTNLKTSAGFTIVMGWVDSGQNFHPYSFLVDMLGWTYGVIGTEKNGTAADNGIQNTGSAYPGHTGDDVHFLVDPRINTKFGTLFDWGSEDWGSTMFPGPGSASKKGDNSGWGAPLSSHFHYAVPSWNGLPSGAGAGNYEPDWEVNQATPLSQTNGTATYYTDPDGVTRPGDGYYRATASGDGTQLFTSNASIVASDAIGDSGGNTQHGRRPVILNRPFNNVGELGYVFRDLPFKTLDFFTQFSGDAALLDVFSVTDEAQVSNSQLSSVVAGKVNPNNAPAPVLQALLSYGTKKDFDPNYNMAFASPNSDAYTLGTYIAAQLSPRTGTGPITSRADLVTLLNSPTINSLRSGFTTNADKNNKAYLEAPVRALSNVTNARTWNLMIDIIAQAGHMSPKAATLDDFIVEGEKRYWLHIAIDRFTGKIVDQQLEPVYE